MDPGFLMRLRKLAREAGRESNGGTRVTAVLNGHPEDPKLAEEKAREALGMAKAKAEQAALDGKKETIVLHFEESELNRIALSQNDWKVSLGAMRIWLRRFCELLYDLGLRVEILDDPRQARDDVPGGIKTVTSPGYKIVVSGW